VVFKKNKKFANIIPVFLFWRTHSLFYWINGVLETSLEVGEGLITELKEKNLLQNIAQGLGIGWLLWTR